MAHQEVEAHPEVEEAVSAHQEVAALVPREAALADVVLQEEEVVALVVLVAEGGVVVKLYIKRYTQRVGVHDIWSTASWRYPMDNSRARIHEWAGRHGMNLRTEHRFSKSSFNSVAFQQSRTTIGQLLIRNNTQTQFGIETKKTSIFQSRRRFQDEAELAEWLENKNKSCVKLLLDRRDSP